ncbi:cellular tumor antigen p53-like isoform X2 [Clytia hemisphaerica]|uniref:p53 DNA-binding domain-containing protein n=1 Tax=Clytia hemisphaerica TaxID=252671 RepID=A0A7M5WIX2_9CNID
MQEQTTDTEDIGLPLDEESNFALRGLIAFDSQDFKEIEKQDGSIFEDQFSAGMFSKEISIPLSPPTTPNPNSYDLIPTHLDFQPKSGRYNFSLFFEEEKKKPSKSCNFTYSHQLGKLFAQKNVDVPITFKTSIALPENFQIRSYLAFDGDTYRSHPVEKCPADLKEWKNMTGENHIIINNKPDTIYSQCSSGHYVTITSGFRTEKTKKEFSDAFSFTCFTTCRGGINRRDVSLLFALYSNNQFYGQAKVPVVICSSPGRDRISKEKKLMKATCKTIKKDENPIPTPPTNDIPSPPPPTPPTSAVTRSGKRKMVAYNFPTDVGTLVDTNPPPNKIYTMQVKGYERFLLMQSLNKAMEDAHKFRELQKGSVPLTPREPSSSPPPDNSLILTNKGMGRIRNHDFATKSTSNPYLDENKVYHKNYRKFEEIRRKVQVRSFKLERSQSDPSEGIPTVRRSRVIFPRSIITNPDGIGH